ncbi:MAG: DUF4384 domain-containing protein [Verrucomicrobiales bacterium]|nr:DUF4384 domain-containing protein [Verrucomicrobiales bacterium]MCP5560330.1 DUF4384 domain-containing protein [Verrucomicrobiaceae bacterium]
MTPESCPACNHPVPSSATHCPTCAATLPRPTPRPAASEPVIGGNTIDRSRTEHHDHSTRVETNIGAQRNTVINDHRTINHSSGKQGGEWTFALVVAILLGLMGVVLAFGLLNKDERRQRGDDHKSTKILPDPDPPPRPISQALKLNLNKLSYEEGELMTLSVEIPEDGYLYLYAVWADGRVDTLYPNELRPDAFQKAGTTLRLPGDLPPAPDGTVMRYPMGMPQLPGDPQIVTESIVAVLSKVPMKPISRAGSGLGTLKDPGLRTRGPQPTYMQLDTQRLDFTGLPHHAVSYTIRRAVSAVPSLSLPVQPPGASRRVQ